MLHCLTTQLKHLSTTRTEKIKIMTLLTNIWLMPFWSWWTARPILWFSSGHRKIYERL